MCGQVDSNSFPRHRVLRDGLPFPSWELEGNSRRGKLEGNSSSVQKYNGKLIGNVQNSAASCQPNHKF